MHFVTKLFQYQAIFLSLNITSQRTNQNSYNFVKSFRKDENFLWIPHYSQVQYYQALQTERAVSSARADTLLLPFMNVFWFLSQKIKDRS